MEPSYAPLENLVISQLAAIRQRETALQQQFKTASQPNAVDVESQLVDLQRRAERLNRMIDAMGMSLSSWKAAFRSPTVA
jgi:methionyl-tRNA formyltransferase